MCGLCWSLNSQLTQPSERPFCGCSCCVPHRLRLLQFPPTCQRIGPQQGHDYRTMLPRDRVSPLILPPGPERAALSRDIHRRYHALQGRKRYIDVAELALNLLDLYVALLWAQDPPIKIDGREVWEHPLHLVTINTKFAQILRADAKDPQRGIRNAARFVVST